VVECRQVPHRNGFTAARCGAPVSVDIVSLSSRSTTWCATAAMEGMSDGWNGHGGTAENDVYDITTWKLVPTPSASPLNQQVRLHSSL
jgi:hypothetical protein